jgi:SAM-dependent methyltransferase
VRGGVRCRRSRDQLGDGERENAERPRQGFSYCFSVEPLDQAILRHYESAQEELRITSGLGQIELLRTQEVLRRHLPPPPARILDVGGGAGVHASWLADDGYEVRIVDASQRHVDLSNRDLGRKGVVAELGDARALSALDDSFDAVLLLGPLYHLTERSDRLCALGEGRRVVCPGGVIAVAAVSRFASLFDGLARELIFDPGFAAMAGRDLISGQHRNPDDIADRWTTAFLHHPDQLRAEAVDAGLLVREVVGLEGLAGYLPHLAARWERPEDRERILWAARQVESEPSLRGLSAHLLLVADAPP